jgi:hypothetical protein
VHCLSRHQETAAAFHLHVLSTHAAAANQHVPSVSREGADTSLSVDTQAGATVTCAPLLSPETSRLGCCMRVVWGVGCGGLVWLCTA